MENQLHWVKKCVFLPLQYFYFEVNIVHLIGKKIPRIDLYIPFYPNNECYAYKDTRFANTLLLLLLFTKMSVTLERSVAIA